MTFLLGGFIQTVQRTVRSTVRPLLLPPQALSKGKIGSNVHGPVTAKKRLYDIFGTLATVAAVNYTVIPFILLDLPPSLEGWRRAHWYGHITVGIILLFFWMGGKKWLLKVQQDRVTRSEGGSPVVLRSSTPTAGAYVVPPLQEISDKVAI